MRWAIIIVSCFLSSLNLVSGADLEEKPWALCLSTTLPPVGTSPLDEGKTHCELVSTEESPFEGSNLTAHFKWSRDEWHLALVNKSDEYSSSIVISPEGPWLTIRSACWRGACEVCNLEGPPDQPILLIPHHAGLRVISVLLDLSGLVVQKSHAISNGIPVVTRLW